MSDDALRDVLGGIPYAVCPVDGVASAGQPGADAWSALARAGYRTVVDLRGEQEPRGHEEPAAVRQAGLEYIAIPVTAESLDDAVFERFREVARDAGRRPLFVHCATANRVGAMLLPYFALDEGRPIADAARLAQDAGLRNQELATRAIDYARRHGAR